MRLPGGAGRPPTASHIRRGVGWGVAIKNLMYSEGFDDYSTARCRLADGVATLKFATAEVGQGFVTIAGADRPHGARRRRGRARADRHHHRLGRLDVGVAPDVDERRSGRRRLPAGARAAVRARRPRSTASTRCAWRSTARDVVDTMGDLRVPVAEATAGLRVRRDRRVPPPPDRGPRRERPGQLPHRVRLRRPPGRGRRRPRARAGQGRPDRDRAGRRPGAQPAAASSARSRAASPRASAWR